MKKALKIIVPVILLLCWAFMIVMPQYSTGFDAALRDKCKRLREIDEPKIVLVGDSSLAFGMNSAFIEEAFGMPVVNMGLHASLGLTLTMDLVKPYLHEGDILIFLPANYRYCGTEITDPVVAWLAIENDFSLLKNIPIRHYGQLTEAFPAYFKKALYHWLTGTGNGEQTSVPYSRAGFNEYGDVAADRPQNIMAGGIIKDFVFYVDKENPNYNPELIEYLNEYYEYTEKKGVVFLQAAPPIYDKSMVCTEQELGEYQEELDAALDSPFISDMKDYIYPSDYFFDTNNHMTTKGAAARTEQLIADLQTWFSKN